MSARNPYPVRDMWFFFDETGDEHGPYNTEQKAKKMLEKYCYWLDHGPTFWQKVWWPMKRLPGRIKKWYGQ